MAVINANQPVDMGGNALWVTDVHLGTTGPGQADVGSIKMGSGAPTYSAPQGSVYLRTDGSSTSTRMYINTTGSTTWTNVVTAG